MRLVFDIETDGLLRGLSVIHCIVARDLDTDKEYRWDNGDIPAGLKFLGEADHSFGVITSLVMTVKRSKN
jgi:DNA polymerase-1